MLQEPPKRFDVRVFVSDVGVFHVHPVAHQVAEVCPFLCEHHHIATTLRVVFLNADCLADVFLGDAEFLFHTEFYGEPVSVPTRLTLHKEALHRLVAAEYVLDGTRHHVVDTGVTVCRGRTFEEYIFLLPLAFRH